ncbi:hypothetical protein SELMODRAFT_411634 [Selaginella moellendorffii]|uniref:Uncharacterized protein n=1 Tax=Selaginella moellendorffii TaxID=88036 RepID=D8RIJ6_SELML|nr:hypothetical protein SELMODRAFT_411634 [Selaginella moellendorffii]
MDKISVISKKFSEIPEWLKEPGSDFEVFYFHLVEDAPMQFTSRGSRTTLRVKDGLNVKKIPTFEIALKAITDELPTDATKSDQMEAFCAVIGRGKVVCPIFILDGANKLKDSGKNILKLFKSLVKQDRKAYLILSDFFRSWLEKLFNPEHWNAFGVGCFKEEEARKFLMATCHWDSDWAGNRSA